VDSRVIWVIEMVFLVVVRVSWVVSRVVSCVFWCFKVDFVVARVFLVVSSVI